MNSFKYRDPSSISSKPLNEKLFFYQACILITGSDSIGASSRSRGGSALGGSPAGPPPRPAPPALPGPGGHVLTSSGHSSGALPLCLLTGRGGGGFEGIRQACEAGEGNPVRSWGSAKAREEKEGLESSRPPPPRPRRALGAHEGHFNPHALLRNLSL